MHRSHHLSDKQGAGAVAPTAIILAGGESIGYVVSVIAVRAQRLGAVDETL